MHQTAYGRQSCLVSVKIIAVHVAVRGVGKLQELEYTTKVLKYCCLFLVVKRRFRVCEFWSCTKVCQQILSALKKGMEGKCDFFYEQQRSTAVARMKGHLVDDVAEKLLELLYLQR